jgi:glycosyltransferase involved in cell wall biosynthesis
MNILLVAEDLVLNGVTRHIIDLANGLVERGHIVIVAASPSGQEKKLDNRVLFIPLSLCYPNSYRKNYAGIFNSIRKLIRTIRRYNIQIIHTHKRYVDMFGWVFAKIMRTKHVSTCHNEFHNYRRLSRFGKITIVPTKAFVPMLVDKFSKKRDSIRIIPFGIVPLRKLQQQAIAQLRQRFGIAPDIKIILSVGHLNEQKDRLLLLEALGKLKDIRKFHDWLCLIVGEGPERENVFHAISSFHLEKNVVLFPAESNIEQLNNLADFCVLTSVKEAIPYVVLEAASIGKPHIATKVGGIPDFIGKDECGICVPDRNPDLFAAKINELLDYPQKVTMLGSAAQEKYSRLHMYDRFIENIEMVYKEILFLPAKEKKQRNNR